MPLGCYHPNFLCRKVDKETGQIVSLFSKFNLDLQDLKQEGVDLVPIPCGSCIGCRLDYAKAWALRCWCESALWRENWFLTLTYDDDHVPLNGDGVPTLRPKDLQDFLKRIRIEWSRKYGADNIRFFACGEYGSRSARPHYHVLLFNAPLLDLTYYKTSKLGDVYYNSPTLEHKWGHGFVVVGELTPESAAYTARYVQKKAGDQSIDFKKLGVELEFLRMSRRPGIGAGYLEKYCDEIYDVGRVQLPGGATVAPGRYFDAKAKDLGVEIEAIKERRRAVVKATSDPFKDPLSLRYRRELDDLEQIAKQRSRILARPL